MGLNNKYVRAQNYTKLVLFTKKGIHLKIRNYYFWECKISNKLTCIYAYISWFLIYSSKQENVFACMLPLLSVVWQCFQSLTKNKHATSEVISTDLNACSKCDFNLFNWQDRQETVSIFRRRGQQYYPMHSLQLSFNINQHIKLLNILLPITHFTKV